MSLAESQAPHPAAPLREVPALVLEQWRAFAATAVPILRWVLEDDEWDWVETSLRGRLDGVTKLFFLDLPAQGLSRHGFDLERALVPALVAARIPGRASWTPIVLPAGLRDVDALAGVLGSFSRHVAGSGTQHVGVVLAPSVVADERRYRDWLLTFVTALVRFAPGVRVVLLDDAASPRYAGLASESAVHTIHASLAIAPRTEAMVDAVTDPSTPQGQLRRSSVQVLHLVRQGHVDDALRVARDAEVLAARVGRHAAAVPLYFAVMASLSGKRRHPEGRVLPRGRARGRARPARRRPRWSAAACVCSLWGRWRAAGRTQRPCSGRHLLPRHSAPLRRARRLATPD